MTIYVPQLKALPIENMRLLDPKAQCSVQETGGTVTAFAYNWSDLKVVINVMQGSKLAEHLQGLVGFVRHGCTVLHKPTDPALERRILSTTLALGFVVDRITEPDCWRDRVQNMIGAIAFNTKSIVFWEGCIYDENAKKLFP